LETVDILTPASRAISWIVARPDLFRWLISLASHPKNGMRKPLRRLIVNMRKPFLKKLAALWPLDLAT
jgi:hypothetical protein